MQEIVVRRLIKDLKLSNIEIRQRLTDFHQDFCFAVTKGDTELLAQLNEGLSQTFSNGIYHQLKEKMKSVRQ